MADKKMVDKIVEKTKKVVAKKAADVTPNDTD